MYLVVCFMCAWCVACSLRGNRLSIDSLRRDGAEMGLRTLTNLTALDLSCNPFSLSVPSNRPVVFDILCALPKLHTVGLAGTWEDVNKKLSREQRLTYFRLLHTLRNPLSPLQFCDEEPISCADIVEAFHPRPNGVTERNERELFRFDIATGRLLNVADVLSITKLDLTGAGLGLLRPEVMRRLVAVTHLNVSNNQLDDTALTSSGITAMPLMHLDVSRNRVRLRGVCARLSLPAEIGN